MTEEKIILDNERLIYSIANSFNYNSKDDLFQAGCLGIIKAYKRYNPSLNCKFTTYAYPFVLGEMRKLIREDKGIKVSREISKLSLRIEKAYILLSQKLMKEPSITEIANFLEIPEYYVSEALNSLNKIKSLDEPITDSNKDLTLQDVIGKCDNIDDLIMLKDALNSLSPAEKEIIENRYVKDYTQSQTSKLIGTNQVQISRSEQRILKKLGHKMAA